MTYRQLNRVATLFMVALWVSACGTTTGDPEAPEEQSTVAPADAEAVRPFTIAVPEATLVDLNERLERTRLPDQLPGTGWEYGTDREYLEPLLEYWRDEFNWRAQETALNRYDHFLTEIDGGDVHFIHQRSTHQDATPLLLVHGWPGSFVEFVDLIGPLTQPEEHGLDPAVAFHVVVPSLPGFGFSGKTTDRGYNPERMADVLAGLMERLGYDRYGAQGGDWGAIIGTALAGNYPDNVIGFHSNFILAGPPPGTDPSEGLSPEELARRQERVESFAEGSGYQEIQGTKPQSVGVGLNDSPAGLAAWIVEKFHGWSDHGGNIEDVFTKDQLLTNIMVYWATESITSASRIYYENRHVRASRPVSFVQVPTAAAVFPKEIYYTPRKWAEGRFNIVRWTVFPEGGHFAALEQPDYLIGDIRAFYADLRSGQDGMQ